MTLKEQCERVGRFMYLVKYGEGSWETASSVAKEGYFIMAFCLLKDRNYANLQRFISDKVNQYIKDIEA